MITNNENSQPEETSDALDSFIENEYGLNPTQGPALMKPEKLMELLEEIADWKLEARLEDNARYFFHVGEVKRIEEGKRAFVIGRKGCGKTAISEYLCRKHESNVYSVKLTFKNFPFNELYELRDFGYAGPHQFITLWKFLIYSHICQLMARNENIKDSVRETLKSVYAENQAPTLPRKINKWLDREYGVELFGAAINIGSAPEAEQRRKSLISRVQTLEDLILTHLDDSKYLIVFDELDEDYRNITDKNQYEQYTSLITGLFKAVQDVRSVFSREKYRVYPTVFLRDDIYDLIQDSDKTKWGDLKIELDWDTEKIKELIAFRISRAINSRAEASPFDVAWHTIFYRHNVKHGAGGKKSVHSFDYIARSTQLRPRDFIQYLKSCCEEQLKKPSAGLIGASVIKKVDKAFSNYLKSELIDEIHGIMPDISQIFDVISQMKKWSFKIKEFVDVYNRQLKRSTLRERDPSWVLQVLFLFSVVGNQARTGKHVFRYTHKDARFNFDESIVVHRGLFKSLQIGVE